jgi:hypothetical protein
MELARFELATSWVRFLRKRFPLVVIIRRLAWLLRFGVFAFAVGCRALSPELDRGFDHAW